MAGPAIAVVRILRTLAILPTQIAWISPSAIALGLIVAFEPNSHGSWIHRPDPRRPLLTGVLVQRVRSLGW